MIWHAADSRPDLCWMRTAQGRALFGGVVRPDRNYRHTKWVGKQAISAATLHKVAYRRNPLQHNDFRVAHLSELPESRCPFSIYLRFSQSFCSAAAVFSLFLFRIRLTLTFA